MATPSGGTGKKSKDVKRKLPVTDPKEDLQKALALEKSLFGDQELVFGVGEEGLVDESEASGAGNPGQAGSNQSKKGAKKQAVWTDPEDEKLEVNLAGNSRNKKLLKQVGETVINGVEYEKRLREQHRKLNPGGSWAVTTKRSSNAAAEDSEGEDDDAPSVLQRAGALLAKGSKSLQPRLIDMTRCKDANLHGPTQGVVQSIEFHPNGQLVMTAGLDKKLRLFQVDGMRNPVLQTVFLEDCPIQQAAFTGGGGQLVAAGRRPHFYVYDMVAAKVERILGIIGYKAKSLEKFAMSPDPGSPMMAFMGDQGTIPLVSLKSRQAVGTLQMPGGVQALAFCQGGRELLAGGTDGMIYLFDIRMQRCVGCQVDEGCLKGTSLAASPDGQLFASGSDSGVVNLYKWDGLRANRPASGISGPATAKPEKAFFNLTTSADSLTFSPDGAILAMASRLKKGSLRLVHVASRTVFSNWPCARTVLDYVRCMAFSPGGGYLAIGNAKGKALLYRLHHYSEA